MKKKTIIESKEHPRKRFIREYPIFKKVPSAYGHLKRKAAKFYRHLERIENDETIKFEIRKKIQLLKEELFPSLCFMKTLNKKYPRKGPPVDYRLQLRVYHLGKAVGKKELQSALYRLDGIKRSPDAIEKAYQKGKRLAQSFSE